MLKYHILLEQVYVFHKFYYTVRTAEYTDLLRFTEYRVNMVTNLHYKDIVLDFSSKRLR